VNARAPEALTLRPRSREPGRDALHDPGPLKLGNRREKMKLEASRRRAAIDPFVQATESDAERAYLVQRHDQVLQVASESVEAPYHEHVEAAAPGIDCQAIECRPAFLGAADPAVDVFSDAQPRAWQ
jgi:hypothetical protein